MSAKPQDAPGLDFRDRKGGERIPYWIASRKAVAAGYPVKSVRLDPAMTSVALALKCQTLNLEMKNWLSSGGIDRPKEFDGSVAALIRHYETEPTSRFNVPHSEGGLKFNTKEQYQQWNQQLYTAVGDRLLCNLKQPDLWRWYELFACPPGYEGEPMRAKAKACMEQFSRLLAHGIGFEIDHCERLYKIMNGVGGKYSRKPMTFKGAGRRKGEATQLSYEQVVQLRDTALAKVNPHLYDGLVIATIIQFESLQRQADVIGQWWPEENATEGNLVMNGRRWKGLAWNVHISPDLVMKKKTSKSSEKTAALFNIKLSPLLMAELERIPLERRIGPVVINPNTGKPYLRKTFNRAWRQLAREAGIPDETQNRDARAGGITEARLAGARPKDTTRQATHASEEMNETYNKETLEAAETVTKLRVARRVKKAG